MQDADWFLRRACEFLGCATATKAANSDLLRSFVTGDVQELLVCKGLHNRSVAEEAHSDLPTSATASGAQSPSSPAPAVELQGAGRTLPDVTTEAEDQTAASVNEAAQPETAAAEENPKLHVCLAGAALPPTLQGCPAVCFARRGASVSNAESITKSQDERRNAKVTTLLLPHGPSLSSLHLLLTHVLAPLAAQQQGAGLDAVQGSSDSAAGSGEAPDGASAAEEAVASAASHIGSTSTSDDPAVAGAAAELLAATHKLAAQVAACQKHLRSEVGVQLPAADLRDVAAAARSEDSVLACERCMEEWVRLTSAVLQREAAQSPRGRGPLAELQFWQARGEVCGGLLEQLSVPAVRATQGVVEAAGRDHNLAASFRAQLSELARVCVEARDNTRFLLTMERHFQALGGGSLSAVADALAPMLNALRTIWVVSRYYGDDVHMSSLLERIAAGLQDRLDGVLDMGQLFRAPVAESLELVRTCKAIAGGWQAHYLAMRERLEASGHPARWEFSRQLLFENTNYAAEVCSELAAMLQAVDDFKQFLGPELKAVTGDTSVIEEVSVMVQAMVEPVEGVAFNPLDRGQAEAWRAVRSRFARDADDIKLATRDLIDTCFRKLRSVDAAAQLLHSFQRIQAQGAMQQQMADKLAAVLEHFIREVHTVRQLFDGGKDSPPLTRNMPPVSGAVRWSRGLLVRLRRTWVRLQGLTTELEALDQGRRAAAAMTELSKDMLRYEKTRFATWSSTVDAAVTAGLQQPLLCRQAAPASATGADGPPAAQVPGGGVGDGGVAGGGDVAINFPPALLLLMREAKYLDQQGFAVPQQAINLALQEPQIRGQFQALQAMLLRHRGAIAPLNSSERSLLREQVAALEAALQPGLSRINWTSLTIPGFVAAVNKAVDRFAALVAQVQKNTTMIDRTVFHITRARLVPPATTCAAQAPIGAAPVQPSGNDTAAAAAAEAAAAAVAAAAAAEAMEGDAAGLPPGEGAAPSPVEPGSPPAAAAAERPFVGREQSEPEQAQPPVPAQEATPGQSGELASTSGGGSQAAVHMGAAHGLDGGADADVPDLQEFVEECEHHRQKVLEGLVARYRSVGPLLVKVEELVEGTATGKSPRLAGYYAYWERRLFGAVTSMVASGLQALHTRMQACRAGSSDGGAAANGEQQEEGAEEAGGDRGPKPLFRVALSLIQSEVVVVPSTGEVSTALSRLVHNLAESGKPFVRWMDGTCIEAPEQQVYGEDAEPFVFSFNADVGHSPVVGRAVLAVQQEVQRAAVGVGRAAARWRVFGALWRGEREAAVAKLRTKKLSLAAAEERMAQYWRVGEEAWAAGMDQDVLFVRVRCAPLAAAVRDEAQAWVRGIAQVVAEEDRRQLDELRLQAAELLGEVTVQPLDEPGVDSVRAALAAVRKAGPGVEATCDELEGRVQTRLSLAAPRDVAAMLGELATISDVLASWKKLQQEAAAREEQGVDVLQVTADSPQSGLLSEGSITLQRSNPLSRAPSTASASHVSASSKRRQPKQRSAK